LIPEHEAVTGKSPGDTQSCEDDSGGPLARIDAEGQWQTYGVVSSGLRFARPLCALGQLFATFGPVTFPFLQAERAWTDPCGDIGGEGRCVGATFQRCETSFQNNLRHLVEDAPGPATPACPPQTDAR
jgi:hypothetical protein